MVSSSHLSLTNALLHHSQNAAVSQKLRNSHKNLSLFFSKRPITTCVLTKSTDIQRVVPLAASIAILLWSNPVNAGILSGSTGLESIAGPQLPQIDFLNKFNDENQKKYAENDERFRSTPLVKELLERSKLNKEKNKQEIQDKYCLRGAEWGIGDCSTDGMTETEKEGFIAMLKKKMEPR